MSKKLIMSLLNLFISWEIYSVMIRLIGINVMIIIKCPFKIIVRINKEKITMVIFIMLQFWKKILCKNNYYNFIIFVFKNF